MEVKCRKMDCKFNNSSFCVAKEITISRTQDCKSYDFSPPKKHKNSKINSFEVGDELTNYVYCPNKNINCDSLDCKFNNSSTCSCNGISLSNDANCLSCIKK